MRVYGEYEVLAPHRVAGPALLPTRYFCNL